MAKVLYFSYDGLLDPLGQSQIVPYISAIAAAGHSQTIVSYEKVERPQEQIQLMKNKLQNIGVCWIRLEFKSGKFWVLKRFVSGVLLIRKLCRHIQPDFIHLRGFVPSIIFQLSRSRVPHLYDFRSFALGEWVDIGKINPSSLLYRILNSLDKKVVRSASGLVVLEQSAKRLLEEIYDVPNVPLKVIRTCTDVKRYRTRENSVYKERSTLRFVFLGGARFPYQPDLALRLLQCLINRGLNCQIDFINERDHIFIESAIDHVGISRDRIKILASDHYKIPDLLATYDCGFIAYDSSKWRRVCSPTKLGEYLAAGLPVISLEGIDITDELSETTSCVLTVSREELEGGFQQNRVDQIIRFIQRPGVGRRCQQLAREEFNLDTAGKLYSELYAEVEARIL